MAVIIPYLKYCVILKKMEDYRRVNFAWDANKNSLFVHIDYKLLSQ